MVLASSEVLIGPQYQTERNLEALPTARPSVYRISTSTNVLKQIRILPVYTVCSPRQRGIGFTRLLKVDQGGRQHLLAVRQRNASSTYTVCT